MKHTYKLLLALVAISFIAACKKNSSSPTNPIVGKWTIVSDTIKLYQGGSLSDEETDSSKTDFIQFNSNGTGNSTAYGFSDTFKWSVSGSTLTVTDDPETVDGIQITGEPTTATIKTLDAHSLYIFTNTTASVNNDSFPETEATHLTK